MNIAFKRSTMRTGFGILATLGLTFSMFAIATPALASTEVQLHADHVGADSTTFGNEKDCGEFGNVGDGVVWHFVLNGLDQGTGAGSLSADFTGAGNKTDTGEPVGNGSTQHFYILTPTDDILEGATATVEDQEGTPNNLVLSHVCHQEGGESPEESPAESPEESPAESPEESPAESPEESPREGEEGGNPTSTPGGGTVPDTALGTTSVPAWPFAILFLSSLVSLLYLRLTTESDRIR